MAFPTTGATFSFDTDLRGGLSGSTSTAGTQISLGCVNAQFFCKSHTTSVYNLELNTPYVLLDAGTPYGAFGAYFNSPITGLYKVCHYTVGANTFSSATDLRVAFMLQKPTVTSSLVLFFYDSAAASLGNLTLTSIPAGATSSRDTLFTVPPGTTTIDCVRLGNGAAYFYYLWQDLNI